jgi:hypothetical protein
MRGPTGPVSMFALLRLIAVVAVIFYFSPVRREHDAPRLEDALAWADGRLPAGAKALWEGLPEGAARQAAGLAPPADTVRPPDRHPPSRGAAPRP